MAVYVDDMAAPYGRMLMYHMMADSTEELLSMVNKIGVNPKWIQYPGTYKEHFDISKAKRELAIKYGAIQVTMREMGRMSVSRKKAWQQKGQNKDV